MIQGNYNAQLVVEDVTVGGSPVTS